MKKRISRFFFYLLVMTTVLASAYWGSRAVTTLSESMPVRRENCIVIDPGHGGEDGGATSCSGRLESGINLEISLRLNDLLNLLGYQTKMIRTTDISVYTQGETLSQKKASDLKKRVSIANEPENTLLLSIHQNYFSDSRYRGAQVFFADTEGSALLAGKLQAAFAAAINPGSIRECKKSSGIYLMEHIKGTGVLIECGFLSNPQEDALLQTAPYQKKLCSVIAATTAGFLSNT